MSKSFFNNMSTIYFRNTAQLEEYLTENPETIDVNFQPEAGKDFNMEELTRILSTHKIQVIRIFNCQKGFTADDSKIFESYMVSSRDLREVHVRANCFACTGGNQWGLWPLIVRGAQRNRSVRLSSMFFSGSCFCLYPSP